LLQEIKRLRNSYVHFAENWHYRSYILQTCAL